MNSTFTFISLLKLIYLRRKVVGLVLFSTFVVSTITAYLIPTKFKSEAIMYPANINPYSVETQTEQMLQMLESDFIRDRIVKEFNLAKEYEIDTTKKSWRAAVIKEYESNITVERTEYESVNLIVYDRDPKVACAIANRIIEMGNEKIRSLHRAKAAETLVTHKEIYKRRSGELDSLEKLMLKLRTEYNILDYDIQAKEAYRAYYKALGSSNSKAVAAATKTIKTLEEKGGEFLTLKHFIYKLKENVMEQKYEIDKAEKEIAKQFSYANVIVEPFPSDKKSFPIRWLIVLSSLVSTFIFTIVVLLFLEFNPFRNLSEK